MASVLILLAIFLVMGATGIAIIMNRQAQRRRYAMKMIMGKAAKIDGKKSKANSPDQRRSDLAKKLKEESEENGDKKKTTLNEKIMQAGMSITPMQFWLGSAVSGVVGTLLLMVLGLSPLVIILGAITFFLGLPRLFLKTKIKRRQKKFLEEFADALESMMRMLKAGMPISEAIRMVSREFTGPIGDEMRRVYDQQKIGVPLPEAVLESSKRMPLTEMQMFATAIAIQTQTGSSLSEVLQNLATVIRSRFKLKRKVQALSAEAKISAIIIGALPVFVASAMYLINPDYILILFTTPKGKFLLGCALAWMSVGIFIMRQMINFKV
jgi:tight adherence protein B